MSTSNRLKNQHLLWRAGFGPMANNAAALEGLSVKNIWKNLLNDSAKKPLTINVATILFKSPEDNLLMMGNPVSHTQEQKKAQQKQSREDLKQLNFCWMEEMVSSEAQFREKISLFWHGHFACRSMNIIYQQQLLDIIRNNAFGNFADLLKQVSKSAAMLQFLNNQQNKKEHPNENFAREVMELFTLGRGNYTETDVKEAARSFTGWGFDEEGIFTMRQNQHDTGTKTFLGKTGNFDGDDILNILLEQQQTARFITKKIIYFFVNENFDAHKSDLLAKQFYQSSYDIEKLMETIFTSHWFYEDNNIGTKIKSPVELLVGLRRLLPLQLQNQDAQLSFQRALGQVLFNPPNVAGWPGGKNWIDSSTLMLRLRIPQIITANEVVYINQKSDDDVMMGRMSDADKSGKVNEENKLHKANKMGSAKAAGAIVDWAAVATIFENVARGKLLNKIGESVLQTRQPIEAKLLLKYLDDSSRENFIKTAVVSLMCTPEYQLC